MNEQRTSKEHVHSDECWEPDSGCDMGRNEKYVRRATLSAKPSLAAICRERAKEIWSGRNETAVAPLLSEAADEIERLERELAKKISADYANGYADGRRAADYGPCCY